MKRFLQVFLLLISTVLLFSCSSTKQLTKASPKESIFVATPPLATHYSTALYKAKINIADKKYSGLFYFKLMEDTSYRVVLLSEFGLNLLDLEYKNHDFTVVNCKSFLDKSIIVNTLKKDLKLLLDFPESKTKIVYDNNYQSVKRIDKRRCFEKISCFYNENQVLKNILRKKGFSHIDITTTYLDKKIPSRIHIKNKRIKLDFELNLIKIEK